MKGPEACPGCSERLLLCRHILGKSGRVCNTVNPVNGFVCLTGGTIDVFAHQGACTLLVLPFDGVQDLAVIVKRRALAASNIAVHHCADLGHQCEDGLKNKGDDGILAGRSNG